MSNIWIPSVMTLEDALDLARDGKPWAIYLEIDAKFKDMPCTKYYSICGIGEDDVTQSRHGKYGCHGVHNLHLFSKLRSIWNQKMKIGYHPASQQIEYTLDVNEQKFHNYHKFFNETLPAALEKKSRPRKKRTKMIGTPVEAVAVTPAAPVVTVTPKPEPKPLVDPELEGRARLKALMRKRKRISDW